MQVFVMDPDDVKIRLTEDRSLAHAYRRGQDQCGGAGRRRNAGLVREEFRSQSCEARLRGCRGDPGGDILFTQAKGPVVPQGSRVSFHRPGTEGSQEICEDVGPPTSTEPSRWI